MARDEIVEYRSQDVVLASSQDNLKKRRMISAHTAETQGTYAHLFTKYEQVCDVFKQIEGQLGQEEGFRRLLQDKFGTQDLLLEELNKGLSQSQKEKTSATITLSESHKECTRLKRSELELRSSLEQKKAEILKYSSEREKLLKQARSSEAAYHAKEKECEELASKLMRTQLDVGNFQEDMKQLELCNKSLTKDVALLEGNIKLLQTTLEHRNEEVNDLKAHVDKLSAELAALDSMNALSTRNADTMLGQLASSNGRLDEERARKEEIQQKLHVAQKECEDQRYRVQQMERRLREAEENLKRTTCQLESDHGQSKEKISQLLTTLKEMEARAKESDGEKEALHDQLEALAEKHKLTEQEKEGVHAELQSIVTELKCTKETLEDKLFKTTTENEELSATIAAKAEVETRLQSENESLEEKLKLNEAALSQMIEHLDTLEKEYKECQEKLLSTEKQARDLKRDYQRQMQSKQLELQKHLQEISRRNNLAMAEMRKEFEAEATKSVDEERKKAQDALENAKANLQAQLAEEKEKYGARIKSLLERNKTQVSELGEAHRATFASFVEENENQLRLKEEQWVAAIQKVESKLQATEDLVATLQLQHSEEIERTTVLLENQHAEAIASLTAEVEGRVEQAMNVQLEALTREATEVKEKLALMEREHKVLRETHMVDFDKQKEIHELRLAELQARLREMEKKCKQQQENHEGMLRNLHVELERCLAEAQEKLDKADKKCMRLEEEGRVHEAQLKERYEQQIEELRQSEMRLEEEIASTRVEAEGHISKLKMEHENMLNKLNMEHEDSIRKTQMEHENYIKKKDLEHDSILKAVKLDHENVLKTQRMEFDNSLRKRKLEQDSSYKTTSDNLTKETAKSGDAKEITDAKEAESSKSQATTLLQKELDGTILTTNVTAETQNPPKTLKSRKKLSGKKMRLQPATSTQQNVSLDKKTATPKQAKQLDTFNNTMPMLSKKKKLKHMEGDYKFNASKMDFPEVKLAYDADFQAFEANADDPYAF